MNEILSIFKFSFRFAETFAKHLSKIVSKSGVQRAKCSRIALTVVGIEERGREENKDARVGNRR